MILIIDDDSAVRSSLSFMLKRAGYEAQTVSGPREAMEVVRSVAPDLILMDMNFTLSTTGEEGLTLLRQVKIFRPETPVILMTAWGSIQLAVQGMQAGAFDFITKPFRRHFTRKVLVVGSASGGKTTLVKDLARTYNAPCSLEYAREYQEKYNVRDDELYTNDYIHLLTDQYAQTAEIIDNGQHSWLIFADTNSTVTKVYIDYYLKENISQEEFDLLDRLYQVTQAREKWDLIFVILPKSNYVDDGSRDMTMADNRTRDWFTKHLLDLLSPFKDKIVILGENCDSDSFFADNYHYAKKTIKERLHIEI